MPPLRYPLDFIGVTCGYKTKTRPSHSGIDLGWSRNHGGQNAPVFACYDGTVTALVDGKGNTKASGSYGNYVIIEHGNGLQTMYAHLLKGSLKVKKGSKVFIGQQIAQMNNSGTSNGSHLHYEVRLDGNKLNPIEYTYVYDDQTVAKSDVNLVKYLKDYKPNPPVTKKFNLTRVLKKNCTGSDVLKLKNKLKELGYKGFNNNNIFGNGTYKALVQFQKDNKVKNSNPKGKNYTGECGLNTAHVLGWLYKGK